jgi:hypothetical protein
MSGPTDPAGRRSRLPVLVFWASVLMMVGTGAIVFGLSATALSGSNVPARWIVLIAAGALAGIAGVAVAVAALVGIRLERRQREELMKEQDNGAEAEPPEPAVPAPVKVGLIASIVLFIVVLLAVAAFFVFVAWALRDFRLF